MLVVGDLDGVTVLLVEDDVLLRRATARALTEAGASVHAVGDGAAALAVVADGAAAELSVVVLDIGLPDSDGRDVCQALRSRGVAVPVLFLTARDHLDDLVSGFAVGGDDYLAKPFDTRELTVRLRALSRRATPASAPKGTGALHLDPISHRLVGRGDSQPLTPTEYRVLAALMGAAGGVVRRRELARAGWSVGASVSDNTLDQYLARLRRKLAAVDAGRRIHTVHGVGYRFD
jgi:two-component system response regulator MprA